MVFKLEDALKAAELFRGWPDTCIISCMQKVMGEIFVTDTADPRSAMALLGDFAFYGGEPCRELVEAKSRDGLVMVPLHEGWTRLIEEVLPQAHRAVRFATEKDTNFDRTKLEGFASSLPEGYMLEKVEGSILDLCIEKGYFSNFGTRENFEALGRGFAVMKDGIPVAMASSYSRYREGIEVDVFTAEAERRKGLATAAAASLILSCLDDGLYPSWDAANMGSVRLAQKLGYEYSHEYVCYEL